MGVCLMGVYLAGVHLIGVYLINVYLTGVHLGRASHGRTTRYGCTPHTPPHGRTPYGGAPQVDDLASVGLQKSETSLGMNSTKDCSIAWILISLSFPVTTPCRGCRVHSRSCSSSSLIARLNISGLLSLILPCSWASRHALLEARTAGRPLAPISVSYESIATFCSSAVCALSFPYKDSSC